MSNYKQVSKRDILRTLQYTAYIFGGAFIYQLSIQQSLSSDVIFKAVENAIIGGCSVLSLKYFTDYSKTGHTPDNKVK